MRKIFWTILCVLTLSGCWGNSKSEPQTQPLNEHGDLVLGHGTGIGHGFYKHVFEDWQDRPRVAIYSHWDEPPKNFDGVHVFLDGEPFGPQGSNRNYLDRMLYIGPRTDTGAAKSLYIPFASMFFAETRESLTPLQLLKAVPEQGKKHFAVYMSSRCVSHREDLYNHLVELAREHNLGEVHALGSCYGNYPETKVKISEAEKGRDKAYFMDHAMELMKDYQYVLAIENTIDEGYVSEKPILPVLAGSIPIYVGSKAIGSRNILNPKRFLHVSSLEGFKSQVLGFVRNADVTGMYAEAGIGFEDLYIYSWHRDVVREMGAGKKTLRDEIHGLLKSF